jgi:Asp-tRNA(Asn)/Glu-tRNA(Gln) amidotransferase A subunit family amidase
MSLANELGVLEAVKAIKAGRLRSVDLVAACFDRIDARENEIGAWIYLDRQKAMAEAAASDARPAEGPLSGIPIAVKDIIDTVDMPTEYGSPIYRGRRPAWDAACVAMIRQAGAIVLGKTVTTEFAYFAPGKTANPRDIRCTPGGSSSGSAAAVADNMGPAAFGSQTAASLIRPAAFCGVVGYKPSLGEFSLAGIKPFAESFDTLGTITRSVADAAYLRSVLLGGYEVTEDHDSGRIRVGICRGPWWDCADESSQRAIEEAAAKMARGGAEVGEVALPQHFDRLVEMHIRIMAFEAARNLSYEYGARRQLLSASLVNLIESGIRVKRVEYLAAQHECERVRREFMNVIKQWDVLLTPSAKGEAPRGLQATGDPLFSRMWTLLGVPSLTLPGFVGPNGLPVGVQLIGTYRNDDRLLAIADRIEATLKATH